jgi:periplasmic protein TonB
MPAAKRPQEKNGASHVAVPRFALGDGAAAAYDDPMSKVLGLDAQTDSPAAWLAYMLGAIALFLGLMVTARAVAVLLASLDVQPQAAALAPQEIDVVKDEPPPPPPEPTAPPEPEPPPAAKATPHEAPPPAAAPAQAAKVLTQEPDPNDPVDLTGNTIVQGNADAYAGGTTTANGTSNRAVRNLATAPTGVPGGTGAPQAKPQGGPDRSRAASVGGTEWDAPFPPESDTAQIDDTYVTLEIDVRPDGTPSAVRVVTDPGYGFGREARKYALGKHYPPALDHDGNPIPGIIKTRVHFSR